MTTYVIRLSGWIGIIVELSKFRISLLVALSSAAGFVLAAGSLSAGIFLPFAAVFVLASGAAALNHYQERSPDSRMPRTSARPLPSGRISPNMALIVSLLMIFTGALLLWTFTSPEALLLGLLTVFWYNGVYTPLKKITPLAVIPGALIGALPPAIGWVAAGGDLFAPFLLALALLFFIWQIPHFWLLLLKFGKEYEQAGYPSLTTRYSNRQIGRFTYFWLIATAVSCMVIPLFDGGSAPWLYAGLFLLNGWLLWQNRNLINIGQNVQSLKGAFININIYILLVMALLVMERLVR